MPNSPPPARFFRQFSLRALLIVMGVLSVVLAVWNHRWEEEFPGGADQLWSFDDPANLQLTVGSTLDERMISVDRVTVMCRRDWRWRKVATNPVRGYHAEGKKVFEALYDDDGGLTNYQVFDAAGKLTSEGGRRGRVWLNRSFRKDGTVLREQSLDSQGQLQGRFIFGTEKWTLLDGHFQQNLRSGPWREVIGQLNLLVNEQWDQGQRQGVWHWQSLQDQTSYSTEYEANRLLNVNEAAAPTEDFLAWLRRSLQPVEESFYFQAPLQKHGAGRASILLDIGDGMRWYEMHFPCGTIAEIDEVASRELLLGAGAARVEYVNLTAQALLEVAMRCDLIIDAHLGRLIITPRCEWSPHGERLTGIESLDFGELPGVAAAWEREIEPSREPLLHPRDQIRHILKRVPLRIDSTGLPENAWAPHIDGFGFRGGTIRDQLAEVLYYYGLRCELRTDTLVITPRWEVSEANYRPIPSAKQAP